MPDIQFIWLPGIFLYLFLFLLNQAKNKINNWAVSTRRNIVNGYTVAYPTDGASFPAVAFEYAKAGGSVVLPAISPINVK